MDVNEFSQSTSDLKLLNNNVTRKRKRVAITDGKNTDIKVPKIEPTDVSPIKIETGRQVMSDVAQIKITGLYGKGQGIIESETLYSQQRKRGSGLMIERALMEQPIIKLTPESDEKLVKNSASKKRKAAATAEGKNNDFKDIKVEASDKSPMKIQPGWKMMYNMGFIEGSGLGSKGQGIIEPVAPSTQQSKRGLGLMSENAQIEEPKTIWSPELDPASATGDIVVSIDGRSLSFDNNVLTSGMIIGDKVVSIDHETRYCDPELLSEMIKFKTMLDHVGRFLDGRSRSNPYERIGKGIFLNRAAMKMANIDSVMEGLLTTTEGDQTLYFADICAGPGGFTEYMLWRRPLESCGFGFTLKIENDFKLDDIICGPVECFHPSYGSAEDGDIFDENNLRKFQQEVYSGTGNVGVHSVLADGGFSVEGQENIQEILSKQLYLCQFLCALNIVRIGGNFLCKLFDTFTDFSVGLIYIMSTLFRKMYIIKPITSRPANSERYILFQDLIDHGQDWEAVREYMYEVNKNLNDLKESEKSVIKILSRKIIKKDTEFFEFIKDINDKILNQQIVALSKLMAFIKDRNLVDDRQNEIRTEALKQWNVPDLSREQYKAMKIVTHINKFLVVNEINYYGALREPGLKTVKDLVDDEFRKDKFVIRNHVAGFVSRTIPDLEHSTYVIVKDRRVVKWYNNMADSKPIRLGVIQKKWLSSIPAFTMLLVHFGVEYGGDKGNMKVNSITVVDVMMIYGVDVSQLPYSVRMNKVANMCKLLDPKSRGYIKPLEVFPLISLPSVLRDRMHNKTAKNVELQKMFSSDNHDRFFPPWKLLIINVVRDPWMVALSRSSRSIYYYNVIKKCSVIDKPDDLDASYSESRIDQVDWTVLEHHFMALFKAKM